MQLHRKMEGRDSDSAATSEAIPVALTTHQKKGSHYVRDNRTPTSSKRPKTR